MSRVLFDQNVPRALSGHLTGFEVQTAAELGWGELENGDLMKVAAAAGFPLMGDLRPEHPVSAEHERPADSPGRPIDEPLGDTAG